MFMMTLILLFTESRIENDQFESGGIPCHDGNLHRGGHHSVVFND
jgi:hypothetical protein